MSVLKSLVPQRGLRVLITAGAGGIGRAIAQGFVEADARVHISDVDPGAVAAVSGGAISGSTANAGDEIDTARLFDEALGTLGGLDLVIANAGIAGPTGAVSDIATEAWDQTLDVNLRGAYLAARFGLPHLEASRGAFIAISSVAGRLGYGFRTPYAASKWGVVGLVKSLAVEAGPKGVRANAVLPGVVAGPRMDRVIAARAEQMGIGFDEMRDRYLQKISLRRMVTAEEIAATCLFLASPGGSAISGQAISVCGNVETL